LYRTRISNEALAVGTLRSARVGDVPEMAALINYHAERHRMLFRSYEELYEHIRDFSVVESQNGDILACCALEVFWKDLAEIKSLAVAPDHMRKGLGRALVHNAIQQASDLGVSRVFALTYEQEFFQRLGFELIDKDQLPHKVWTDCVKCHQQHNCKEIAMILRVEG